VDAVVVFVADPIEPGGLLGVGSAVLAAGDGFAEGAAKALEDRFESPLPDRLQCREIVGGKRAEGGLGLRHRTAF